MQQHYSGLIVISVHIYRHASRVVSSYSSCRDSSSERSLPINSIGSHRLYIQQHAAPYFQNKGTKHYEELYQVCIVLYLILKF